MFLKILPPLSACHKKLPILVHNGNIIVNLSMNEIEKMRVFCFLFFTEHILSIISKWKKILGAFTFTWNYGAINIMSITITN